MTFLINITFTKFEIMTLKSHSLNVGFFLGSGLFCNKNSTVFNLHLLLKTYSKIQLQYKDSYVEIL